MSLKGGFLRNFIFLLLIHLNLSFNLSPVPNLVIKSPDLSNDEQHNRSSYFGFSIVLREKSILIGAPRANSTATLQANLHETGAIYKCPLDPMSIKTNNLSISCKRFVFDDEREFFDDIKNLTENPSYQWLGGAMDGSSKDNDPFLVCAPRLLTRNATHPNLRGLCYKTLDTLGEQPNKNQDERILRPFRRANIKQLTDEAYYAAAQLGFSAHITKNNKEFLMGAPGLSLWAGSLIRYLDGFNITYRLTAQHTYNGYAIGSGYFHNDTNRLSYVTAAPRINEAFVFSFHEKFVYTNHERLGLLHAKLKGRQIGEYYGYALLVSDINGDKLDDLIITAPQHKVNDVYEVGAIYVYLNKGNDSGAFIIFEEVFLKSPFPMKARFGTTITSLGDINDDGYNDIAVGAPFFEETGAVAIYHGSANGLQSKPCQIIKYPGNFDGSHSLFGHGISKGVDIDGNGFTDLAISAPNIETVYIYRSYPVIVPCITFTASAKSIQPETKNLTYTVCYSLKKGTEAILILQLDADQRLRRVRFNDTESFVNQTEVLARKEESCITFAVNVNANIDYMFSPINTLLNIELKNNGLEYKGQDFCTECVTLNRNSQTVFTNVVESNLGCGLNATDCNVDLQVDIESPLKFVLGVNKTLNIGFNIKNLQSQDGRAYKTKLTVTNSLKLSLVVVNSNCKQSLDSTVVCDIRDKPYYFERNAYQTLIFDIENITDAVELYISSKISSDALEIYPSDNMNSTKIQFVINSFIEIIGNPHQSLISFGEDESILHVFYIFTLKNRGPSIVKNFNLTFCLPVTSSYGNQQPINYINSTDIFINSQLSNKQFESKEYTFKEATANVTQIWSALENLGIQENRTQLQVCGLSNETLCITKTKNFDILKPQAELIFNLSIYFKPSSLREFLRTEQNDFGYFIDATVNFYNSDYSNFSCKTETSALVIKYLRKPNRPAWIYILGIIAGILLVALLTFTLFKLGFFKRITREEMNLILENQEAYAAETAGMMDIPKAKETDFVWKIV